MHRNDSLFAPKREPHNQKTIRKKYTTKKQHLKKGKKMKKLLIYLSAMPLLALAPLASAITCDDIELNSAITDKFPRAKEACLEVVERNGEPYVRMKAELVRNPRGNHAVFRVLHADGTYGPTQAIDLDPSWRARIEGRNYRLRDLAQGQELDLYLPQDRWAVHMAASDSDAPVEMIAPVTVVEPRQEAAEPEPMLPATASNMPLFAVFGVLALIGAGMIRVARRQSA
jgi:LPXTG-motif cell wall-anchored protein